MIFITKKSFGCCEKPRKCIFSQMVPNANKFENVHTLDCQISEHLGLTKATFSNQ